MPSDTSRSGCSSGPGSKLRGERNMCGRWLRARENRTGASLRDLYHNRKTAGKQHA
jgi:hypothetical protein